MGEGTRADAAQPARNTQKDRTPSQENAQCGVPHGALHPLFRECEVHQWYVQQIPWRTRNRRSHFPNYRPLTRGELVDSGLSHRVIAEKFVCVEYGMHVHIDQLLPATTGTGRQRIRRIRSVTLVLAHLIRHPSRIATGFAAATFYGMRFFVDEEPLEFFAPAGASVSRAAEHIVLRPTRRLAQHGERARTLVVGLCRVRYSDPGTTLSYMLRALTTVDDARSRRWQVPDLSGIRPHLTPEFIRCVQVSDAFHQGIGAMEPGSLTGLLVPGGVDADLAGRVLGATDIGAESPQETLLRLAVSDLAPGLRSQIPVFNDDGTLLTSADLGWEERGVYLFYDGAHHLQRTQRDHDSRVLASLQRNGGRVLRVVAENLRDADAVSALRMRIIEALG